MIVYLSFFSFSLKAPVIKKIVNIIYGGDTIHNFMCSYIFFIFTFMWNLVLEHSITEYLQRFEWWLWCLLLLFECNHLAKANIWKINVLVFCFLLYKGEYFYARKDSCSWCLVAFKWCITLSNISLRNNQTTSLKLVLARVSAANNQHVSSSSSHQWHFYLTRINYSSQWHLKLCVQFGPSQQEVPPKIKTPIWQSPSPPRTLRCVGKYLPFAASLTSLCLLQSANYWFLAEIRDFFFF